MCKLQQKIQQISYKLSPSPPPTTSTVQLQGLQENKEKYKGSKGTWRVCVCVRGAAAHCIFVCVASFTSATTTTYPPGWHDLGQVERGNIYHKSSELWDAGTRNSIDSILYRKKCVGASAQQCSTMFPEDDIFKNSIVARSVHFDGYLFVWLLQLVQLENVIVTIFR